MTIHTTTADENGNFSITLTTPLTSGETIEVKAQKDDQSKTIVIQAPSEPYLPPSGGGDEEISAGFVVDFPIKKSIYSLLVTNPSYVLYSSKQLLAGGDKIKTITNKITQSSNAEAYVAFRIPFEDLISGDFSLAYASGSYDYRTGVATYSSEPEPTPIEVFKDPTYFGSEFVADEKYLYFIFNSNDMQTPNYCHKIIYNGVEYEARFSFLANAE